jgi:hypothetical protein
MPLLRGFKNPRSGRASGTQVGNAAATVRNVVLA